MINEQSSASGHDYASDRSAIGAGTEPEVIFNNKYMIISMLVTADANCYADNLGVHMGIVPTV